MSWTVLFGLVFVLGVALLASISRRAELTRMARSVRDRERAVRAGSAKAQLQHPIIDLSRCLGCGTCVEVCPEDGVLELVHGQAMVVNGARCMGISACERECPVGAITVTLSDVEERTDIPVLSEDLEAVGSPGLFLAGEVTAHALIKTAVEHGTAVAAEVARRIERDGVEADSRVLDLCIVGAGPAGLACSLEAERHGLRHVAIDQEAAVGGTVAKYPRQKLVLTQPVDLPLHGRLRRTSYTKEQLIELWQGIAAEHHLPIRHGEVFLGLDRDEAGHFVVRTSALRYRARNVCIAIGRRGTPTKLGVPGEDLPKVQYGLLDAHSYQGRRVLVVGGGDSAVETAMGLAEQSGNRVTLSYRGESFFRIRSKNEERLNACVRAGTLRVLLRTEVLAIRPDVVVLAVPDGGQAGPRAGAGAPAEGQVGTLVGRRTSSLPNDDVFVMAGGVLPAELLERSGVSFDPALRPAATPLGEQGTGLQKALVVGLALTLLALAWALWHRDYYALPAAARPAHPKHALLRPELSVGLGLGIASATLIAINLLYLVRRSALWGFRLGSLRLWMTSHVATGILALLCALLHGAMAPRDTAGGHAFWALAVLLLTGAIGRYFYAAVPRAANGRELQLAEVKSKMGLMSAEWDRGQRQFRERVRNEVTALIEAEQWRGSFLRRVLALLGARRGLRRLTGRLAEEARQAGIAQEQIDETLHLARRAHRTALMVAHYEDLRAVLNTWRWLHRWVAALLVLLLIVHVVDALVFGAFFGGGGSGGGSGGSGPPGTGSGR